MTAELIPPLVSIAGGTAAMRDDRRGLKWNVELAPFSIGRHPVVASGTELPLTNVSWLQAIALCNDLSVDEGLDPAYRLGGDYTDVEWDRAANGYRLPTEAEWQYACRAGTSGYRYGELDDIAWYDGNSEGRSHPVGQKEPNPWGLYDMLGNVWEWCWDLYDEDVYGAYRLFRGGGWAESARGCGSTVRRRSHPTFAIDDLGLRLARNCA